MEAKQFKQWLETQKHGRHNQKRHGYRYGGNLTLDRARGMRRDGNWADYRKRADAKKKPKKGSGAGGGGGGASTTPKKSDQRKKKLGRYADMNDSQLQRELDKNIDVGRQLSASNRNYWGQRSQGASAAEMANMRERVQIEAALYGFSPGVPSLGIKPIEVSEKSIGQKKSFKQWLHTTKPRGGSHGASIKNPRVYEALRRQGHSKESAARISNAMAKRKADLTKTVAGRKLPASAFLVVGDPEKVTTWALPVRNADGSPDTRRMGAAWAALHGGYRGNKYEGEGKAQAIVKLRRMYAEQGRKVPSATKACKELNNGRMWVTTDKEGRYRWVAISSNSYQDREGEIVSQKALERAVERGDKGDLLWWHDHRAVIGSCDFQMIHGRMLIESGTFKSKAIGAAFAKVKGLGVSVGFARPANEPISGVYENIKIYERSALPAKRAANALTTFGVM